MDNADKLRFPEFKYVISFKIDHVVTQSDYDLFKNQDEQYITVSTDLQTKQKTVVFYRDYEQLASVFATDFTELEMLIWK